MALDQLVMQGLTVKAIFRKMLHRYSKPGFYLLNKPFYSKPQKGYLPQLADCMRIAEHTPDCAALRGVDPSEFRESMAQLVRSHQPGVFHPDAMWPWASNQFVTGRGCTCYRSRRINMSSGCSMPDIVRKDMVAMFGGSDLVIIQNGLGETESAELECPAEELGYIAHVKRITGRHPHKMTSEELDKAGLLHAHPASDHWVIKSEGRLYPLDEAREYVSKTLHRRSATTTANMEAMFPTNDDPTVLDSTAYARFYSGLA